MNGIEHIFIVKSFYTFSLERSKGREGANLEYLKNVTISYLTTSDPDSKKKMLNAIGAVLKFDDNEIGLINKHVNTGGGVRLK